MNRSLIKLNFLLAGIALSSTIFALEIGGITVTSGLGQQLDAGIKLVAVNDDEKNSLVARLSSPEIYKMKGIGYPQENDFHFQIEKSAKGDAYLKITSSQPIDDQFIVLLINFKWSSGNTQREYSFFLDKPQYLPTTPNQIETPTLPPLVETASSVATANPDAIETIIPVASAVSSSESFAAASSVATVSSVESTISLSGDAISGSPHVITETLQKKPINDSPSEASVLVKRGDTLSKIAEQYRFADVTVERMLVATYRINIDEFNDKNMNRIDEGKTLRFPTLEEVEKINQSEAMKEIREQIVNWHIVPHRVKSAANTQNKLQVSEQVASGKIVSSTGDKAPIKNKPAKEVIKISKGDETEYQINPKQESLSKINQGNEYQEDAIAKRKQLAEEKMRAAALKNNLQALEKLQEITSQVAVTVKQPASSVEQVPSKQDTVIKSFPWKWLINVSLLCLLAVLVWMKLRNTKNKDFAKSLFQRIVSKLKK